MALASVRLIHSTHALVLIESTFMFKLWKIGWNRIEKVGIGKYKIDLRTNMKNSSRKIRIANACFLF